MPYTTHHDDKTAEIAQLESPSSVASCVRAGARSGAGGPGDPDYAVSARKRVVYTASGPTSVVQGREAAPGLPSLGPKPCNYTCSGRNRVVRISWSRSPHRLQTWPTGHTQVASLLVTTIRGGRLDGYKKCFCLGLGGPPGPPPNPLPGARNRPPGTGNEVSRPSRTIPGSTHKIEETTNKITNLVNNLLPN